MEKISHVPNQPAVVPSLCGMLTRDQSLRSDTCKLLGTSGNVSGSPRAVSRLVINSLSRNASLWNQSATDENPVRDGTGKRVARSDQRSRETIATPRFARKPSTMKSFFQPEGSHPQKHVADQQRLHPCWKIRSKTQVSACSGSPSAAMWYGSKEVDMVESVDDSKSSRSIPGYTHFPNFEMLDARIASALNKIIQNSHF